MSFEIVDALIHNQHFAVEAGVGIGKSFGYLVPVLLYKKLNKPVIVATSTIALQEQLWNDVHDVMVPSENKSRGHSLQRARRTIFAISEQRSTLKRRMLSFRKNLPKA